MAPCAIVSCVVYIIFYIISCVVLYHAFKVQSVWCCQRYIYKKCFQCLDHVCTTSHYIGDENGIMAKHGSLGEFDHTKGDWKSYVERAKQYFLANDITDEDKQRAILLSCCGDATYRTIKDVMSPQAPGEADSPAFPIQHSSSPSTRDCRRVHLPAEATGGTL